MNAFQVLANAVLIVALVLGVYISLFTQTAGAGIFLILLFAVPLYALFTLLSFLRTPGTIPSAASSRNLVWGGMTTFVIACAAILYFLWIA